MKVITLKYIIYEASTKHKSLQQSGNLSPYFTIALIQTTITPFGTSTIATYLVPWYPLLLLIWHYEYLFLMFNQISSPLYLTHQWLPL